MAEIATIATPEVPATPPPAQAEPGKEVSALPTAPVGEAPKTPAEEQIFKLRYGKEEREIRGTAKLKDMAERAYGSEQRFAEAKKQIDQVKEFYERIKSDPYGAISELTGKSADDLAAELIKKKLQYEMMDEKDRRIHDLQSERDLTVKQKQQLEEAQQKQAYEAEVQRNIQMTENLIQETLESTPGLPKTPETIRRFASYMQQAYQQKIPVTMEQIAAQIQADYTAEYENFSKNIPDEKILDMLPKAMVDKILSAAAKQVRPNRPSAPAPAQPVQQAEKKFMNQWEAKKALGLD